MPYSYPSNVPRVAKNWTAKEQKACVGAANAVLKDGGSEQDAIFACIHAAGKSKKGKQEAETMPDDVTLEEEVSEDVEAAATAAEKKAQQARSKRYGISIQDDGNATKPGEWSNVPDSQWGDPVNYKYPCPDKAHAANAKSRFQQNKGSYDTKSRAVVRQRLNRLLRKFGLKPFDSDEQQESQFSRNYFLGEIEAQGEEGQAEDNPHKGMFRIPAARQATLTRESFWFGTQQIVLDQDLFESFIDNWQTDVVGNPLAIDQSHDVRGGALAWIEDVQIEDGSLVLYAKPTSKGNLMLGDVFKYASIWYTDNFRDQETSIEYGPTLLGCAATNVPFVHRQEPMAMLSGLEGGIGTVNYFISAPPPGAYTKQDQTVAEAASDETKKGGKSMPEQTSVQTTPATIQLGDKTFTVEQLQALVGQNFQLSQQIRQAKIDEVCKAALDRCVAPVVVEAARQVMNACDNLAEPTVTLTHPQEGAKKVNFFDAVAYILSMVPGKAGELTHGKAGEKPSAKKAETPANQYTEVPENLTLEQAEEMARQRRQELGIKPVSDEELEA